MTAACADDVLPSEAVRLLTEIGFLAAGRGRAAEAKIILDGVRALRPHGAAAFIGMALAEMNAGRPGEAVQLLRGEALAAVNADEADDVRVFLALALKLDGRPRESAEVLDSVTASSGLAAALRADL